MRLSEVEPSWRSHDLDCLVVWSTLGHRCGYVRVPEEHPWHNLHYSDPNIDVAVHGGLTYSGSRPSVAAAVPGWWFGFDCAHAGDTVERWTTEAVSAEVELLAEQLAAVGDES